MAGEKTRLRDWLARRDMILIYPVLAVFFLLGLIQLIPTAITWGTSVVQSAISGGKTPVASVDLTPLLIVLLCTIGLYLVHERRGLIEAIGEKVDGGLLRLTATADGGAEAQAQHSNQIKAQLARMERNLSDEIRAGTSNSAGIKYLNFETDAALKGYLNRRTEAAEREVSDFTWAHNSRRSRTSRSPEQQAEAERLEEEHSEIVSEVSKTRLYREIFILSRPSRLKKLERRARDRTDGYFCRVLPESPLPRLQYVLIDGVEAIFASANHPVLCSVTHPGLVGILQAYFEEVWDLAAPLVQAQEGRAVWDEAALAKSLKAAPVERRSETKNPKAQS